MRPRINVSSTMPGAGRINASANVIATWDEDAPLVYVEEAIKQAARDAIMRARVVHRIEARPRTTAAATVVKFAEGGFIDSDGSAEIPGQLALPGA